MRSSKETLFPPSHVLAYVKPCMGYVKIQRALWGIFIGGKIVWIKGDNSYIWVKPLCLLFSLFKCNCHENKLLICFPKEFQAVWWRLTAEIRLLLCSQQTIFPGFTGSQRISLSLTLARSLTHTKIVDWQSFPKYVNPLRRKLQDV